MKEKKYLMVIDYKLGEVLYRIKQIISTEEFYNTKILVDTGDQLPDGITLKYVVISITCVVKDDGKFYPELFLKEALLLK